MRLPGVLLTFALCAAQGSSQTGSAQAKPELTHVSSSFRFTVHAGFARVAPLFGPEGERGWAGKQWNPVFLYPAPGGDVQGAVFTVQHGPHTSVWVNTVFDLAGGRMQYVAFIPDVVVTTVDVHLTAMDESHTAVEVTYHRTALQAGADEDVRAMGESDRASGPKWREAIEGYLGIR